MGCDIHCYIEYSNDPDKTKAWNGFGGRINPGRAYGIFAALVGVRNYNEVKPLSEPRGLPAGLGWTTAANNRLYISSENPNGDGHCSPENAKRWVESGSSKMEKEHWVTNPDWHSHSWCTADEIESILPPEPDRQYLKEYIAVIACLRSFDAQGCCARMVFWFDN